MELNPISKTEKARKMSFLASFIFTNVRTSIYDSLYEKKYREKLSLFNTWEKHLGGSHT